MAATDATARSSVLTLAGISSIGAGAVHGACAGVHAAHPTLARCFAAMAAAQIVAGVIGLLRPGLVAAGLALVVNVVAVGAWLVTRLQGIGWFSGLETREAPAFADSACAGLGAVAVAATLSALLVGRRPLPRSTPTLYSAAVVALALPAMLVGGSTVHMHDSADPAHAAHDHATTGAAPADASHDHAAASVAPAADAPGGSAASTPATHLPAAHQHPAATAPTPATPDTAGTPAMTPPDQPAPWPRPWDPAQPLDLAGVPGVSAEQEARAARLVAATLVALPKWSTTEAAVADGYRSIGDASTGSEHFIKMSLINDDVMLDPTQPESLVYTVHGNQRTLAGAMFIASARPTDDPTLTDYAGPLMTWHNHGNLCWGNVGGALQVVGVARADGTCERGVKGGDQFPMVHVWITSHPCGVFAALEGVGAGQAAVPEAQRTDMCAAHDHGAAAVTPGTTAHDHGAGGHTAPPGTAPPVAPRPYDPTLPIDLSGTPGVTPQQQAAAENLIAVTVVRLPRWADYRTAEAAGFRSIGDAATGTEHYIKWDWINDDVTLDPDQPESLVYVPQPDGTKKLVSAMYMLPDTVTLDQVPDIGGALMQWHIHDNLCFTADPEQPRVAGLTDVDGNCPSPLQKFRPAPMIHVWIVPHPCGPFAALEGVGAGQIEPGKERLCDHAHGAGGLLG